MLANPFFAYALFGLIALALMSHLFTGKATYDAGSGLPEQADDVSDLVELVSPTETPLLNRLGDGASPATSTLHEWIEDELWPNRDQINDAAYTDPAADTTFVVDHASYFQVDDLIQVEDSAEVMLVTAVNTGANTLTVVRAYGGTTAEALANDKWITILSSARFEGADAADARAKARVRRVNYTQIFAETILLSGSEMAAKHIGVADEYEYQKDVKLRECLRNLENTMINGFCPAANPEGSATVRRSMKGLRQFIVTNRYVCGTTTGFAAGSLSLAMLHHAQRYQFEATGRVPDVFAVPPLQATGLGLAFGASQRQYGSDAVIRDQILSIWTEYGQTDIAICRWVPRKCVLALHSPLIKLKPLQGRSFHHRDLAAAGDYRKGQVLGEYTLELRNEKAHGIITNLSLPT